MPNTSRVVSVFLAVCWLSLGLYTLAARAAPQPPAEPHVPTTLAATTMAGPAWPTAEAAGRIAITARISTYAQIASR